jgi:TonB family protein
MSPVAAWFLYCTLVGGLLGLAAWSGEEAARSAGRPGRLLWFAAMLASVAIPGVAFYGPDTWAPPLAFSEGPILVLSPIVVSPSADHAWSLERVGVKVWLAMSAVLGSYLLLSFARLRRARRTWRRSRLEGVDVWLTRDVGPAVYGIAEASILMPAWALELDERLRRLMLLHEEEHARAGDPQLVVAALIVLIAMPWNVALWWQLRRLRMAVEVDCDARVLRREPDRRRYGTLLLEVGRRRGGSSLVVAFAEPRAFLERRIRRIAVRSSRRLRRAAPLALVALTLFAAAFTTRDPVAASEAFAAGRLVAAEVPIAPTSISERPVFTPYTVKPELLDPDQVAETLRRLYPPLLKDAGIGGTTILWFHIDEAGTVVNAIPFRSSGYQALDQAAADVAFTMRFLPALHHDRTVPVWVQIPITFASTPRPSALARGIAEAFATGSGAGPSSVTPLSAPDAAAGTRQGGGPMQPVARIEIVPPSNPATPRIDFSRIVPRLEPPPIRAPLVAGPVFTPYTRKPVLTNADEVARALQRNYPPLLRDSGTGGTTVVWFLIDERGAVQKKQIYRTSGHAALDEAALSVADRMRFRAAENRDEKVPVWVQIPITFSSR